MPIMESSKSFDQFECSQIVLLLFHANNCNQSNFRWKICIKVCVSVSELPLIVPISIPFDSNAFVIEILDFL